MNSKAIIECTKHMLSGKLEHAVIRIVIFLLENSAKTSAEKPFEISSDTPFLQNHFNTVGDKAFIRDIKTLSMLAKPYIKTSQIGETENSHIFELQFKHISAFFSVPIRCGRKQYIKSGDVFQKRVDKIWCHWLKTIGSQGHIYKKTPTRTPKRESAIKNALNILSFQELISVIDGCMRSPFHMGYDIAQKSGKITRTKHYCEPVTIFRNEDKMRQLIIRCSDRPYQEQVDEARARFNLRNFDADTTASDISSIKLTDDYEPNSEDIGEVSLFDLMLIEESKKLRDAHGRKDT